jgi:hypothetical protein
MTCEIDQPLATGGGVVDFAKAILFLAITGFSASSNLPQEVFVPDEVFERVDHFEPSAILYLADLNQYLVASDDTNEENEPLLFLMNQSGKISRELLSIKGLDEITDIESISQDGQGIIYLMASLGLNKNGKEKSERNLFVRARRQGKSIQAIETISLRSRLIEAMDSSIDSKIQSIKSVLKEELDVESHFIRGGELFLGLKNPNLKTGESILLNVGAVEDVFSKRPLQVKIWKTIPFSKLTGEDDELSDIQDTQGGLLMTSTLEFGAGRLWSFQEATGELKLLSEFKGLHPEGLALDHQQALMMVFDEGDRDAHFLRLREVP